jgi:hypothetical protein
MYNFDEIMIPDGTVLREKQRACHFGTTPGTETEKLTEMDRLDPLLRSSPRLDPIDDDPSINEMLRKEGL